MDRFKTVRHVFRTLRKRGASCKIDNDYSGDVNIIATWHVTTWRILVIPAKIKTEKIIITKDSDFRQLKAISSRNHQKAIIAYVLSDDEIIYFDPEKGNTVMPRCIVKRIHNIFI